MLTFKIINNIDELEDLWNCLLQTSNTENIFLDYYWVRNWVKNYQHIIKELCVIVVFDKKKCIAINPFYVSSFQLNTLSLIGTNEPEECEVNAEGIDIIYLAQYRKELLIYLVSIIEKHINAQSIIIKNINEFSLIHDIAKQLSMSKFSHQSQPCYQFIFTQFDNIENTLLTKKKNKRTLNKFIKDEYCIFEVAENNTSKNEFFDALIKLHHSRWRTKGKHGVFGNQTFFDFHKTLLSDTNFSKHILLSAIKYKQEIISVNYSFHIKDKIYFYQAGINTTFNPNFSPGLLNHLLLIKQIEKSGVNEYNLLLSHDIKSYKSGLSNDKNKLVSIAIYKYKLSNLFKIIRLKLSTKKSINI